MNEKDAFYVVRKGDIIGVYKNFSDCQDQAGSSVCDSSMSVYKGYGMTKEAEKYLDSHGLKNAAYSINACHVKDELFGQLVACPIQKPVSHKGKEHDEYFPLMRTIEDARPLNFSSFQRNAPDENSSKKSKLEVPRSLSSSPQPIFFGGPIEVFRGNLVRSESSIDAQPVSSNCNSCILEFDGASKGNPGQSGAGAVLRAKDGSVAYGLREGVGHATNNVAEYRAVILGLRTALKKGFRHIRVLGDSKLVCMQMQGLWKIKNQNMADLCKVAVELKDKFSSFHIEHVLREYNSAADAHANHAIYLKDAEVEEIIL